MTALATTATSVWTLPRLFEELRHLGRLRVITITPGSVFEAICQVGPFGVAQGHLNVIRPDYHWHLDLDRVRFLATRDEVHARSGRRVLCFTLAESTESPPSVSIYLHRERDEELGAERELRFADLHAELATGVALVAEVPS